MSKHDIWPRREIRGIYRKERTELKERHIIFLCACCVLYCKR